MGLTIDSQSLDIPGAWEHNWSLRRLLSTVAFRGSSEVLPYVDGRDPNVTRPDEIVVDLELMVFGDLDGSGTPHASRPAGLDENLEYLAAWARGLADGATPTYAASLETSSSETYTADVQVINWQILRDNATQVTIGYDLRIPAGLWTPTP